MILSTRTALLPAVVRRLALLLLLVPICGLPIAMAAERPNILWLVAEDFGPDLGCYGTKEVSTPNLDRLAAAGRALHAVLHHRAGLLGQPLAFMTGMYQTTIGAHNHRSHRDDGYQLPDGVRRHHRLVARRRLLHGQRPRASRRLRLQRHRQDRLELHLRPASRSTPTAGPT